MNLPFSFKSRRTIAIVITSVLAVTLLTNIFHRYNYKKLEASFSSIYKDRLLAESYLFNLYEKLKKKQDVFQTKGYDDIKNDMIENELNELNQGMSDIIVLYEETYLTLEEDIQFYKFKKLNELLISIEEDLKEQREANDIDLREKHIQVTDQAFGALAKLSNIQTKEGQVIKTDFEKSILTGQSNIVLEVTLLIVIGLFIIGIIYSSRNHALKQDKQAP